MFKVVCCSIIIIIIAIRVDVFNGTFYLFINIVIWEVIVNKVLFKVFMFRVKDNFRGGYEFGIYIRYIRFLIIAILYCLGH